MDMSCMEIMMSGLKHIEIKGDNSMYLVYEKNYLNYDIDCVEETDMKLWATKEKALADMEARKEAYIEDEDNDFTFMEDESSDDCLVFADKLNKNEDYRSGEFHICLVELVVND